MSTDIATREHPEHPKPSAHHTVNIFINGVKHTVEAGPLTGARIAALGGVPEGNQLFLEVSGPGDDELVAPDRSIEPRSGMRFYDVPAGHLG